MKAFGKILGLIVLGLLLIIVALLFTLTHLFDPNDYKDEIRQIARDKANLELQLRGDIGWSLFPWLGLELTDATLASAETPDKPFADLRMIGLSVRVMPLLRKEVQMSDIRVQGLTLTLNRDKAGKGNWEDIGKPAQPAGATPATPAGQAMLQRVADQGRIRRQAHLAENAGAVGVDGADADAELGRDLLDLQAGTDERDDFRLARRKAEVRGPAARARLVRHQRDDARSQPGAALRRTAHGVDQLGGCH